MLHRFYHFRLDKNIKCDMRHIKKLMSVRVIKVLIIVWTAKQQKALFVVHHTHAYLKNLRATCPDNYASINNWKQNLKPRNTSIYLGLKFRQRSDLEPIFFFVVACHQ
jgi:hypothetical protein